MQPDWAASPPCLRPSKLDGSSKLLLKFPRQPQLDLLRIVGLIGSTGSVNPSGMAHPYRPASHAFFFESYQEFTQAFRKLIWPLGE